MPRCKRLTYRNDCGIVSRLRSCSTAKNLWSELPDDNTKQRTDNR